MTAVFVDTNVWFSAFYGSKNCQKILQAHVQGKIRAAISQDVLDELVRNIKTKVPKAVVPLETFLRLSPPLIAKSTLQIPKKYQSLANKKDLPILFSAYLIGVKTLVTGNTRDFDSIKIEKIMNIKVLDPNEAVKMFAL